MLAVPEHYSKYDSTREALVGFAHYCRSNGLSVGLSHSLESAEACLQGIMVDQQCFRYSLKSLLCTSTDEFELFDKCFDVYWLKRKHKYNHKVSNKSSSNVVKNSKSSIVMAGFKPKGSEEEKEQEEASNVSGISKMEALKQTDFSKVSEMDNKFLDELSERLLKQLNSRLKRKMQSSKKGNVDIRKSVRDNLATGDDIIKLARKKRKIEKNRLILLLDVSGSMDRYSFYLLRFIWSLKSNLKQVDAYIFSTELIRITEVLKEEQLMISMIQLSAKARNWSGGTKIGECLRDFNELYAKRALNGRNMVIILSDGLDDGNPALVRSELEKIKLRTRKLIWLNPLKGMNGYQPLARGMAAALPSVDSFHSAHNLSSLMELEKILGYA